MRRRKKGVLEEKHATVDMTPMLDIIFIMLIFFIVSTSFVKDQGFVVDKAQPHKSANNSSKNILIQIDENGTIFFNNQTVDIERIGARIESHLASTPTDNVLLLPHEQTDYQTVVSVLDQIKPFKRLKITIGVYKPR